MPMSCVEPSLRDGAVPAMEPPVPSSAAPRAATRGACFAATSAHGALRLWLDGVRVRHAADAALALHRDGEPLLRLLEDWSGLAVDWRWIDGPASALPAATHVPVRCTGAAGEAGALGPRGVLELPWALLRALPAPPAATAGCLQWPAVPAVLSVARFALPADELATIEVAGAVLLPDAFRAEWLGSVRGAAEPAGCGVAVELRSPFDGRLGKVLVVDGGAPSDPTADRGATTIDCEVRVRLERPLPADRLAGWTEGEALPAPCRNAGLWARVAGDAAARCVAAGVPMPWGRGWALRIESVDAGEPR